jgi:outer membrane lipoprotein SlyB
LPYIAIFLCTLVLEVGWIVSVRAVTADRAWTMVVSAVLMQGISNASTLILVSDRWTSLASMLGAAAGAMLGMRISARALLRGGPSTDVL